MRTRFSEQRRARLARQAATTGHKAERAAASAQLAYADGEDDVCRALLDDSIAQRDPASLHSFEELATAAVVTQHFDRLAALLTAHPERDSGWHAEFAVTESNELRTSPKIIYRAGAGESMFLFRSVLFQSDFIEGVIRVWLKSLPLFFRHSQHGIERGQVEFSAWDAGIDDGLAMCANSPGMFLLPDSQFLSSLGHRDARDQFEGCWVPWTGRDRKVVWRGSTTGQARQWRELPRIRLCELAREHGSPLLDVGITKIVQISDSASIAEIERSGLMRDYMPWRELINYKYQLDVDGNSNSWAGFFQRLLTGSPVLKVASPLGYRQWFYGQLKPWENFIPVASDMSDLVDKVAWLAAHDAAAQEIGDCGRRLALSLDYPGELLRSVPTFDAALRQASFHSRNNKHA